LHLYVLKLLDCLLDELCENIEQIYAIFWLSCDFIIFHDDMNLLCLLITIVSLTNALPRHCTLWRKYLSQMHCHVSCHLHIIYDEYFCHKILDTSSIMWLAMSSYLWWTFSSQRFCLVSSHITSHQSCGKAQLYKLWCF
jgi:hypothetical protein